MEIVNFVDEVDKTVQEKGYETAFQMAMDKIHAFPTCENCMSRPRQHRHLKRKNSILFLVFLDFPHFFIHSGWQDTLF